MWSYDIKCKYVFIFLLKKLACERLKPYVPQVTPSSSRLSQWFTPSQTCWRRIQLPSAGHSHSSGLHDWRATTETKTWCHESQSWHGNVFNTTGPWIPLVKLFYVLSYLIFILCYLWRARNGKFWHFLCCWPELGVEQIVDLPVIWDAMMLMWCHCNKLSTYCQGKRNL